MKKLNDKQKPIYKRWRANLVAYLNSTILDDGFNPLLKPELYQLLKCCQVKHPDGKVWRSNILTPASFVAPQKAGFDRVAK